MDRIIEIRINGSHLWKDNRLAGVQGEGNVNFLRITFDESWDGFAKKVTFWDAKGNNPVERTLTADLLEDITVSTLTYLCPIPPEPMAEAGMMTFVIDGWVDGKRARSVGAEMEVEYAPMADNAGEPTDPTPTQAEQLQGQIDTLLGDMQQRAVRAENAADAAEVSEANAKQSEDNAKQSETVAQNAAAVAEGAREEVATASAAAVAAAESAEAVEDRVLPAAEQAVQAAASAKASENIAVASAESAEAAAEAAATHEVGARAASAGVDTAKNEAVASAAAAAQSEAAAKAAQAAAEKARDEATEAVGGDFASKAYVDDKAEEAEGNANRYTDQRIAEIPEPENNVFIAVYGTTTKAEITAAVEAGKTIVCKNGTLSTSTHMIASDSHRFFFSEYDGISVWICAEGNWHTEDYMLAAGTHADTHAADGADAITPESIGAADAEHSHTAEDVGAADADHTHTPADIGAAAEGHTHTPSAIGAAPAYTYGTEDMEAGVTPLASGTLYFVYE